jgi:hypothetical protein
MIKSVSVGLLGSRLLNSYAEAVLKFGKLNTQSQQRGAVVQERSLPTYRLRYLGHLLRRLLF